MSEARKHTEVAVGILLRGDGAMLLSTRPPGKPYAGYWEFPGGKLEAGETVEQALRRELEEELGITIASASVWKVTEHDYPHALVRLHWCKVGTGAVSLKCAKANPWLGRRFPSPWSPYCQGPTLFSIGWSRSSLLDLLLIL